MPVELFGDAVVMAEILNCETMCDSWHHAPAGRAPGLAKPNGTHGTKKHFHPTERERDAKERVIRDLGRDDQKGKARDGICIPEIVEASHRRFNYWADELASAYTGGGVAF
jgi:hypothetical protein